MQGCDRLDQAQAETVSRGAASGVKPLKALERALPILRGDAGTRVRDLDRRPAIPSVDSKLDSPPAPSSAITFRSSA